MTDWTDLRTTALVGTSRRPFDPDSVPGFDLPGGELGLLSAAALLAAERAAGLIPDTALPEQPAPADDTPEAPDAAIALLDLILAGGLGGLNSIRPLLSHWVARCDADGLRIPHRFIVSLLRSDAMRTSLEPTGRIVGNRGRWVAAKLEIPLSAAEADTPMTEGDWTSWPVDDRIAHLRRLRCDDADNAREVLLDGWDGDPALVRSQLLGGLSTNLGLDDHPLLEELLDNRSKRIRGAAIELLRQLPESEFSQRMADRLALFVSVEGRLRKKLTLGVPPEPDESAVRDGVPTGANQFIAYVASMAPLDAWRRLSGLTADQVVGQLKSNTAVIDALSHNAIETRNAVWALALLPVSTLDRLVDSVEPEDLVELLKKSERTKAAVATSRSIILHAPAPWSAAFTAAVVAWCRRSEKPAANLSASMAALEAGIRGDQIDLLHEWLGALPNNDETKIYRRNLRQVIKIISTKASIDEAFDSYHDHRK